MLSSKIVHDPVILVRKDEHPVDKQSAVADGNRFDPDVAIVRPSPKHLVVLRTNVQVGATPSKQPLANEKNEMNDER
jgi:hypothetical protein